MANLTAPVTRLMGNLRYATKFTLVSVMFIIPLVMLFWLYWQTVSSDIAMTKKELRGVALLEPASKLVLNVGKHRGLTHVALNGDSSALAKRQAPAREMAEGLKQLNALRAAAEPKVAAMIDQLNRGWQQLSQEVASASADDASAIFQKHNQYANLIRVYNEQVTISYELELEPSHVVTVLIDKGAEQLPFMIDLLGQFRGHASGIAAKGSFSPIRILPSVISCLSCK